MFTLFSLLIFPFRVLPKPLSSLSYLHLLSFLYSYFFSLVFSLPYLLIQHSTLFFLFSLSFLVVSLFSLLNFPPIIFLLLYINSFPCFLISLTQRLPLFFSHGSFFLFSPSSSPTVSYYSSSSLVSHLHARPTDALINKPSNFLHCNKMFEERKLRKRRWKVGKVLFRELLICSNRPACHSPPVFASCLTGLWVTVLLCKKRRDVRPADGRGNIYGTTDMLGSSVRSSSSLSVSLSFHPLVL